MCNFNWQSYNFDTYSFPKESPPPGKMLLYPIEIQQNGSINNLPNVKSFPDYPLSAKVFGTKSYVIPEKVTT